MSIQLSNYLSSNLPFIRIEQNWKDIASKCVDKKEQLALCSSEEACRAASVALQLCTATIVCPSLAQAFIECTTIITAATTKDDIVSSSADLNNNNNNAKSRVQPEVARLQKAGAVYSSLLQCLELFEADSVKIINARKK